MEQRNKLFVQFSQIALVTLLIIGCLAVLEPFIAAILFANVICITTWPIYEYVCRRLHGRRSLAAFLMLILLSLVVLIPTVFLAFNLADGIEVLFNKIRPVVERGAPETPPEWVIKIPLLGQEITQHWQGITASQSELSQIVPKIIEPARKILLQTATLAGQGILQLILVIFVAFFFYRDGASIGKMLATGAYKLGGELGSRLLTLARSTINGVMIGIVGTAFGQAVVTMIGLTIAGVPGASLLSAATFFLSMLPIGPPLIWGGAAFWLYSQDQTGWAIFMLLYGLLVISSVDNFIKPMLISRSADLPLLLIVLGVFGGVLVFGFVGIFLGPTLLALGLVLADHWTREQNSFETAEAPKE